MGEGSEDRSARAGVGPVERVHRDSISQVWESALILRVTSVTLRATT